MIQVGDEITVDHDIIGISGLIHLSKDQKVKITDLEIVEGYWGKNSGVWYPSKLIGVRVEEIPESIFFPTAFKETKNL